MPEEYTKITCAAGRHPARMYSAVNDLPLLKLCYEHWLMAYENPEELMQLVLAKKRKGKNDELALGN